MVEIEPGNELVVLSNYSGPSGQSPRPHHTNPVVLAAGANEVTIPPTFSVPEAIRYVRTERKNADGLAIFEATR